MFSKFFAGILKTLLIDLVSWAYGAAKRMIARKKRVKKTQDAAREVENANSNSDIRDSIDDLP
jgi:hypothetical protein